MSAERTLSIDPVAEAERVRVVITAGRLMRAGDDGVEADWPMKTAYPPRSMLPTPPPVAKPRLPYIVEVAVF